MSTSATDAPARAPTSIRRRLLDGPPAARHRELVSFIVAELREALDMDAGEELHARSRFTDLGVDSKRALEFKEFLEQELECSLRTTLIFDYPTPDALAGYILRTAFGAGPAGSDPPTPTPSPAAAGAPAAETGPAAGDGTAEASSDEELLRAKLEKYGV